MAKEWIEQLTQEIKTRNRDAAEEFGRRQHQADVVEREGRVFFGDLVRCLEDNLGQIRRQLQGDPTSAEITLATTGATQIRLMRSRFPFFDAHITHAAANVTLEYVKDQGLVADPSVAERKVQVFAFRVSPEDKLSVEDAFGDGPAVYRTPDDLAQKMTQILLKPETQAQLSLR